MIDRTVALLLIVLLSPVLATISLVIWFTSGRPIVFIQSRGGLHGAPFDLLKFRSMRAPRYDGEPDADRRTWFGTWLRSWSLDELPSLVNIVRGEMVFVGPRPLHERYLERYNSEQLRRLDRKPGLTGWAQVNGRNAASWEQKFEMDVWYVRNRTALLDLKILAKTAVTVANRHGIDSPEGGGPMPEFFGDHSPNER